MKSIGHHSIPLYLQLSALLLFIPVCGCAAQGFLMTRFGAARTLTVSYMLVASGITILLLFGNHILGLAIGLVLYSVITAVKVVRNTAIGLLCDADNRVSALSINYLFCSVGQVLGPFAWLLINEYTPYFIFSAALMIVNSFLAWTFRHSIDPVHFPSQETIPVLKSNEYPSKVYDIATGSEDSPDVSKVTWSKDYYTALLWFLLCQVPTWLTVDFHIATLQPSLIEIFNYDADDVAKTYMFISFLSTIPPFLVSFLSKILPDRLTIKIGLFVMFFALTLYLPLFGTFQSWQVVLGFFLVVMSSNFTFPCMQSVLTERIDNKADCSQIIGITWSVGSGAAALLQLCFAQSIIGFFGSWTLAFFFLPNLVAVPMTLNERLWRLGDATEGIKSV